MWAIFVVVLIAIIWRLSRRRFALSFTIQTKGSPVILPPITVFSNLKQPMDLNPVRGGQTEVDESVVATVTVSNESAPGAVTVVPDPAVQGGYFILTPLESGSAHITISAPDFETAEFDFSYVPFVAGQFNPVFGTPVSDS